MKYVCLALEYHEGERAAPWLGNKLAHQGKKPPRNHFIPKAALQERDGASEKVWMKDFLWAQDVPLVCMGDNLRPMSPNLAYLNPLHVQVGAILMMMAELGMFCLDQSALCMFG